VSAASTPVPSGPVDLPNVDKSLVHKFPPIMPGSSSGIGHEKLQLEAIATLSRTSLMEDNLIKDRGNILNSYEKCFIGSDLMTWMVNYFAIDDRNMVRHICDLLLTRKIVHHVSKENERIFLDSSEEYYRYQEDCLNEEVLNFKRIWDSPARVPAEAIRSIQRHLDGVYKQFSSEDRRSLNFAKMKGSIAFRNFALAVCELQVLDTSPLPFREKLAFYINVHNALCMHAFHDRGEPDGKIERWRMRNSVSYNVNKQVYSIADIKHGILRGNQKQPFSFSRQFGDDDPRKNSILGLMEPRVHFALNEGTESCGRLRLYTGSKIDKELQEVACHFCQEKVKINSKDKVVFLPEVFKEYQSDFASSEPDLLKWIATFLPESEDTKLLITEGALSVEYE